MSVGNTAAAMQAVDQLDQFDEVDQLHLRLVALRAMSRSFRDAETDRAIVAHARRAIDAAIAADRFDEASGLATVAQASDAGKGRRSPLFE